MFRNRKTGRTLAQEIKDQTRKMRKLIHKELPAKAEEELLKVVDVSFQKEKYHDGKSKKWKARKGEKGVGKRERRNLLVKEGHMVGGFTTSSHGLTAKLENPIEYTVVHNEGLKAGRGKGFQMPQRQMAPIPGEENRTITKNLYKFLDKESDKIMK